MARRIKLTSGVLNVRLHPHPDGVYGDFIERIYSLRKPVRIRGDRYAMFSLLDRSESGSNVYTGLITTFTKIDTSEPWFDASELKEAASSKVSQIKIPDGLFPNAASFHFLFDAKHHRFFFQTYSSGDTFSIRSALRLVQYLSEDPAIVRRFGEASITIVQSEAGLEVVFSLPVIKRVTIVLEKPNADIFEDDFDEKVEAYLAEMASKRLTVIAEAEKGKSINVEKIARIAESALEHGFVKVDGRDDSGATTLSTESFPTSLHDKYDPDLETESRAFRRLTGK